MRSEKGVVVWGAEEPGEVETDAVGPAGSTESVLCTELREGVGWATDIVAAEASAEFSLAAMKAPPFFALGIVVLGVAASALGFLSGTSAEQEGEERFGPHHSRHTFYCEHSATGDSVDQVLSGHITFFRPIVCETTQVVHVMAGKGLTLWSHGVLSTSNVHFVVHKDATLILRSKEGIDLRRHEVRT
eukprot:jgi/Undpi1/13855/HiC_scaffold_9.g03506.m1